jgi:glycosyltransferase involved in cell wall biosynthesis
MYIFIEQEIPHYRVGTLNALNRILNGKLVVFSGKCPPQSNLIEGNPGLMEFKYHYLNTKWILNSRLFITNYFIVFANTDVDVVIVRDSIRSLLFIPFILYCRFRKIPVVLWGQGYSRKRPFNPRKNLIDLLHLWKLKLSSAYVAYSQGTKKTLEKWVISQKVFVANNTINLSLDSNLHTPFSKPIGRPKIVFIGRLQKRKKVDILLHAISILQSDSFLDFDTILIGNGEEAEKLKMLSHQLELKNLQWAGERDFEESQDILTEAHLVVIPGWLGLAVNHAFYFGLPVITEAPNQKYTNHPPEVEALQDGVNGLFYEPDNPQSLADAILCCLKNRDTYSEAAFRTFREDMSLEAMMKGFTDALNFVCNET